MKYHFVVKANDIVSGWMGMIKSRSIIPHSPTDHGPLPTDHSPRTTPHHSGVTGIDMKAYFLAIREKIVTAVLT
jgi:hypothetical protein